MNPDYAYIKFSRIGNDVKNFCKTHFNINIPSVHDLLCGLFPSVAPIETWEVQRCVARDR